MMKKFNKDGAWIWNTYQCYLKANITVCLIKKHHFFKLHWQLNYRLSNVSESRNPGPSCWTLWVCPRRRVSVWESSWCVEPTWTKRGSWQRKKVVRAQSTSAGRTLMTGREQRTVDTTREMDQTQTQDWDQQLLRYRDLAFLIMNLIISSYSCLCTVITVQWMWCCKKYPRNLSATGS